MKIVIETLQKKIGNLIATVQMLFLYKSSIWTVTIRLPIFLATFQSQFLQSSSGNAEVSNTILWEEGQVQPSKRGHRDLGRSALAGDYTHGPELQLR